MNDIKVISLTVKSKLVDCCMSFTPLLASVGNHTAPVSSMISNHEGLRPALGEELKVKYDGGGEGGSGL